MRTRGAGTGAIGTATSAVMPSGMRPSALGNLDLHPVGARGQARGLGDEAHLPALDLAGDQPNLGAVAGLDAGELALGHLDHRQHRIERDQGRDLAPGQRERGLTDLDRHVVHDARPGRAHDAAVALGLGGGHRSPRPP